MVERIVDPTRQGGEGNAGPTVTVSSVKPMTVDEALAFAKRETWRTVRAPSHRAMQALADEVQRLRDVVGVLVDCDSGDWRTCNKYPWSSCCVARLRAQGKTTQELVQTQSVAEDDGA